VVKESVVSKITSKGQLTVPKRIREALGLKKGTDVEFILDGNRAFLQPVRGSRVASVAGALRGFAPNELNHCPRTG
jgi:AbrB family looped-hinge helix DNA binding protein